MNHPGYNKNCRYVVLADQIASEIAIGKRPVGSRLPGAPTLADEYQLNVSMVSRAIRDLEQRGLVMIRRGRPRRGTNAGAEVISSVQTKWPTRKPYGGYGQRGGGRRPTDVIDRLAAHSQERPCLTKIPGVIMPCWIRLTANGIEGGYQYISVSGVKNPVLIYRVSYREFIGDIPSGLQIDHLCGRPSCWNPWHLEAVTSKINNVRRSQRRRARRMGQS